MKTDMTIEMTTYTKTEMTNEMTTYMAFEMTSSMTSDITSDMIFYDILYIIWIYKFALTFKLSLALLELDTAQS